MRDSGAVVSRVDADYRQRRIGTDRIATVTVKSGGLKPRGRRALTTDGRAAVRDWLAARRAVLAARAADDILRTVDHLNLAAQSAQARTTDAQPEAVTDAWLLAMHDPRQVPVRQKAQRRVPPDAF